MFCAISGSTPTEPVISPAGHLFEKSLVTKALKVRGSADRPSPLPAGSWLYSGTGGLVLQTSRTGTAARKEDLTVPLSR